MRSKGKNKPQSLGTAKHALKQTAFCVCTLLCSSTIMPTSFTFPAVHCHTLSSTCEPKLPTVQVAACSEVRDSHVLTAGVWAGSAGQTDVHYSHEGTDSDHLPAPPTFTKLVEACSFQCFSRRKMFTANTEGAFVREINTVHPSTSKGTEKKITQTKKLD